MEWKIHLELYLVNITWTRHNVKEVVRFVQGTGFAKVIVYCSEADGDEAKVGKVETLSCIVRPVDATEAPWIVAEGARATVN